MSAESKALVSDEQKLSKQLEMRNVNPETWNTLKNSIFPGAQAASILMAIDYCKARKLDVLKKPCHIVPMSVKDAKTGDYHTRDVILPGIYEYRTTAQRTGLYLGHTKPEYGPEVEGAGVTAPQWCEMTFLRWNEQAQRVVEFPVRVYFREVVGLTKKGEVNDRWTKAPVQMLTKCTEAAGLREAFPEELGGEMTIDEVIGQTFDHEPAAASSAKERLRAAVAGAPPAHPKPDPKPAAPDEKAIMAKALEMLRSEDTLEGLNQRYKLILDEYEVRNVELPIDVEAVYRDLKEAMEQRSAP